MIKKDILNIIKENNSYEQYTDNEEITKIFLSKVDGINVNWESNKVDNQQFDTNGDLNVDWGIKFKFTPDGMNFEIIINKITGILTARHWDWEKGKENNFQFNFVSNGFKIDHSLDGNEKNNVFNFIISDIYIDLDKKTIKIY